MASTCKIYKHGILLGSGTCSDGSASVTSFTAETGAVLARRNVEVTVTQSGTHAGRGWRTRVLVDDGAGTLTLKDVCPFVGA